MIFDASVPQELQSHFLLLSNFLSLRRGEGNTPTKSQDYDKISRCTHPSVSPGETLCEIAQVFILRNDIFTTVVPVLRTYTYCPFLQGEARSRAYRERELGVGCSNSCRRRPCCIGSVRARATGVCTLRRAVRAPAKAHFVQHISGRGG